MKKILSLFALIFILILMTACNQNPTEPNDPTPSDPTEVINLREVNPTNDVYYQIFVRSFADSNGDGIGDLNGITDNLDYLEELGITALWLLPINPSPSYHGYSVTDYYDIESDYGTMADFENLIEKAAAKDIKIVIDLVINHTSDQHPWYLSAFASSSSPYRDYYIWQGNNAFESFVGGMKDLNFRNPAVIEEVKNIMDFYLDKGVHGFRVDAAKHLLEGINAPFENTLLLLDLNLHIKEKYPNSFIVSEVFEYNYLAYADYYIGSDSVFNFSAASNIWDKVGNGNNRHLFVSNLKRGYDAFRYIDPDFVDSPFIGNHDLDRIASMGGFSTFNTKEKITLAARILLTLPGSPFIYYGDELGMKGYRYEGTNIAGYGVVYDEYRRQPFLWGNSLIETTWLPSDGSNNSTQNLAAQRADQNSLFNVYKDIIEVRRNNPALMYGNDFSAYKGNNSSIQGYVRHYQYETINQAVLVIHNLSSDPITVSLEYQELLYGSLNMAGYGTLIVTIDPAKIGDYR
ncbi:MAG: alpha-amylase family glycosyl hydrolase [Acholeplasmataceae bacterium]|nr:alpha-amylase family glycosyl hydrolase [Acholeplasmataceae bacterium]